MKKILAIMLAAMLALTLAACSNSSDEPADVSDEKTTVQTEDTQNGASNRNTLSQCGVDFTLGEKVSSFAEDPNVTCEYEAGYTLEDKVLAGEEIQIEVNFKQDPTNSIAYFDEMGASLSVCAINNTSDELAVKDLVIKNIVSSFDGATIFDGALTVNMETINTKSDYEAMGFTYNTDVENKLKAAVQFNEANNIYLAGLENAEDVEIDESVLNEWEGMVDSAFQDLGEKTFVEYNDSFYICYNGAYYGITGNLIIMSTDLNNIVF